MTARTVPKEGQETTCEFRVRYAECDAMGYLHHARYWEYIEHTRTELLRRNGYRYRNLEAEGILFVVYKAAIKYLGPVRYDDLVHVTARVERITRTRVDHSYSFQRDGLLLSEATSTLACVGCDGRPICMPDAFWVDANTP